MAKGSKVRQKFPYLFTLPTFGYLIVMMIFPLVFIIWTSLLDYNLFRSVWQEKFVGGLNYMSLFVDPEFWNALRVQLIYVAACVGVELVLAIGLMAAVSRIRLQRVIIFVILMPMVIMPSVAAWHWNFMYNDMFGLVAYFITRIVGTPISILGTSTWALPGLIVVDVWQWTPFMFLILFAGLVALPHEPYEASLLDGASGWQIFRYITLPMLKPAIVIAVILRIVDAFRDFDKIYIMTEGGPASSTKVLSMLNYKMIFYQLRAGRGAALSLIMLFIAFGLARLFISVSIREATEAR